MDGQILIDNVSFSYPTRSDALIFNNINLNIPAGSVVAIVGSSGSGMWKFSRDMNGLD